MDQVQLVTFQAVIEEGSFDAAARALHVTPSAVSQRIKALEQDVGQVLVRRVKPCEPTEAGQSLVRLAGQIALLEREALDAARGAPAGGGRTRLAVVVNADSLHTWFLRALAAVPSDLALSFDLHQDDQDHTADLLRAGTAMAAVTAQDVAVQGCRVEKLGAMRYLTVAAPGTFEDYATSPMIVLNRKDRLQHRFLAAQTRRRLDPPIHYVPAAAAFVDAIRLGLGWGLVPEQIARDDITAGRFVDLAPGRHLDVPLHWQYWRLQSAAMTALTEAVKAVAAETLR
ncbi:LysR family transcriptional regulator ArgP [Actinoplanes friuliensis]|uniref:HTH-type transcriptional regulator LysG n=1 Tax=Actinoplanes friuliensis DSM 7358 TaxID=1246995 RepID=U5WDD8_9ACTN|nr:LysR family transcriptional regulator ArgP [Actinoplanes friuliensis]AGZ45961.1 chromosome replication initiation inhibitor protein [Actinoplanes friuliensis DSM 7358]